MNSNNLNLQRLLEQNKLSKAYISQDTNKVSIFDKSSTGSKSSIFNKVQDSVIFQNAGQYTYSSLAPNAPADVMEAWDAAAEKAGVNALDASTPTQLSALFAIQTEKRVTSHSTDVLGNSVQSAIAAVSKALSRMESQSGEVVNTKVQEYRNAEKKFYEQFMTELYAML